ncbi:hypothetical protein [Nonomuraea sp. B5E05]|uniref:hypothetical protein n=1 Tax=Nonomuraea sp. B5E05 TaxID=3153569 RepID=UPI00326136C9
MRHPLKGDVQEHPRTTLVRRLSNLAVLEPVNIVIFGVVAFVLLPAPLNAVNVTGFVLVTVHLLIGGGYWAIKVRQLRARLPEPPFIGAFGWLRRLCEAGLIAGDIKRLLRTRRLHRSHLYLDMRAHRR